MAQEIIDIDPGSGGSGSSQAVSSSSNVFNMPSGLSTDVSDDYRLPGLNSFRTFVAKPFKSFISTTIPGFKTPTSNAVLTGIQDSYVSATGGFMQLDPFYTVDEYIGTSGTTHKFYRPGCFPTFERQPIAGFYKPGTYYVRLTDYGITYKEAGGSEYYIMRSSPDGYNYSKVLFALVQGAGAGGGLYASHGSSSYNTGGGSGGFAAVRIELQQNVFYKIVVGAGGVGANAAGSGATNGGYSSVTYVEFGGDVGITCYGGYASGSGGAAEFNRVNGTYYDNRYIKPMYYELNYTRYRCQIAGGSGGILDDNRAGSSLSMDGKVLVYQSGAPIQTENVTNYSLRGGNGGLSSTGGGGGLAASVAGAGSPLGDGGSYHYNLLRYPGVGAGGSWSNSSSMSSDYKNGGDGAVLLFY